jgi:predicted dehydrogenase/threonine dehydrogenase-like Zn-dependent dehydrogenase
MKQVLQDLKSGETLLADVPAPKTKQNHLRIATSRTLVSAGTERMLLEFGRANYLDKARQQPEKVKQVLDKVRTDGLMPTVEAVQAKLDQPMPLGYCNVGRVLDVADGVDGVSAGDRVVSNGNHAEVVRVPRRLTARVPDDVSDDQAAFTVVGAIGLQGIRLVEPTLGERFVVTGLGLIGLLTVQLLQAHGCKVMGIDFDEERLALARAFGAETCNLSQGEDPIAAGRAFSGGRGVDGVIITAATDSNEPVHQAATMCRKRGRIVLVGVAGLDLQRSDFYEKELSFQVSCSYGPGRYDATYEEEGLDYPIGFVRWTEQRNFEAVLEMLSDGRLDVDPLISHRFSIDDVSRAYEVVGGAEPSIGILLDYPQSDLEELGAQTVRLEQQVDLGVPGWVREARARFSPIASNQISIGAIGAGNYATRSLFPALQETGARLKTVSSSGGMSGVYAGKKFGFEETTTDTDALLADPEINTVVIATRHDTHADLVVAALEQGKHVFVEKPLAIDMEGLERVERTYEDLFERGEAPLLMVGFNRRFAPHIRKMRELLGSRRLPKTFIMTVNAGDIPGDHWTQDPNCGGGRIIGEGCHFVDLLRFLADRPISHLQSMAVGDVDGVEIPEDKMTITMRFEDGSLGTIHYFANGDKSFPKERLELFSEGAILQLDNFIKLHGFGWPGFKSERLWSQDKGNAACIKAFIEAIESGAPSPIPVGELFEVTRATFEASSI